MKNYVYLDSAATTEMSPAAIRAMVTWTNRGNPSANSKLGEECRQMMNVLRTNMSRICGINGQDPATKYRIVFTSGASESNVTMIRGVSASFRRRVGIPHFVVSAIEHKSVLAGIKEMEASGAANVTYLRPGPDGTIDPAAVAASIRPNTALVCVMHANNETGAINDIAAIGAAARSRGVPFHTDTAQTFGKIAVSPIEQCVDSFSVSFHKIHGPPGIGALVVRSSFYEQWGIEPLICGSQNDGARGGTENMPGIGAAYVGLTETIAGRREKNIAQHALRVYLIEQLSANFPVRTLEQYKSGRSAAGTRAEVVVISASGARNSMPGIVLLSVVALRGAEICNRRLLRFLEMAGILVSIGSACNASAGQPSHVLAALGADRRISAGALRVSFDDATTREDLFAFVSALKKAVLTNCGTTGRT